MNTITTSSVWMQPDHIRLVWLTMLALADWNGVVQASLPGLAHVARVPLDLTQAAIDVLSAPDPFSRTPDHEGRRITAVPGGWQILNYAKYRGDSDRREYERLRKQAQRAAKKGGRNCPGHVPGQSPHQDQDLDPEIEIKTSSSADDDDSSRFKDPGYQALKRRLKNGEHINDPAAVAGGARKGGHVTDQEGAELLLRVKADLSAEAINLRELKDEANRHAKQRDAAREARNFKISDARRRAEFVAKGIDPDTGLPIDHSDN